MHFLFILTSFWIGCASSEKDTGTADTGTEDTGTEDTGTEETGSTDSGIDPTSYEDVFTSNSGCGDYYIYAKNADDSIGLKIMGTGLAQAAHDAGGTVSFVYDFSGADDPTASISFGENIHAESCNDAIDPSIEVVVDKIYVAVAGSLTLTATPTGEATDWGEMPTGVEVLLENISFCANGSVEDCIMITEMSFETGIGWLPG